MLEGLEVLFCVGPRGFALLNSFLDACGSSLSQSATHSFACDFMVPCLLMLVPAPTVPGRGPCDINAITLDGLVTLCPCPLDPYLTT